ncbi:hypothetical protein [Pseudomonas coronafaciens]|uniref:hypothetical protein n=1 Tax=Pseudomonas coronafaciens TaxID=53409 RepID=UPI000EFFAC54|nr:hypothetical protein [Pseudomonas coronafaciens]RMP33031.1 hypothetical protein ALQ25_01338 [Pseudomonas coronafaciens pv. atropurpurea]
MPCIKLRTYWQKWMTFDFSCDQLLALKKHLCSGTDSTFRIGGYVFRYAHGYLHFANSGRPDKYYFDTPLNEILAIIDQATANHGRG